MIILAGLIIAALCLVESNPELALAFGFLAICQAYTYRPT